MLVLLMKLKSHVKIKKSVAHMKSMLNIEMDFAFSFSFDFNITMVHFDI